ncbi:MAG: hypothetical protein O7D31_07820 [Alphaproteobacteria bacterium]|nr:hypothetical protein [Alphaproteobacteria bacterium]
MTDDGVSPPLAPKLPVWRTVVTSYLHVFAYFGRFLAFAWLPFLLILVGIVSDIFPESPLMWMISIISGLAAFALFAVCWHRFLLLGERGGVLSQLLSAHTWRVFGLCALFLFVGSYFPLVATISIILPPFSNYSLEFLDWPMVLSGLAYVFFVYFVLFCLGLRFPATALDRPLSLIQSWRKLAGNRWRFATVLILTSFPIFAFDLVSLHFLKNALGRPIHITTYSSTNMDTPIRVIDQPISLQLELFYHLYQWTFFLVAWAVLIAALSATYRHLIGVSNVEQNFAHGDGGEDENDQIDGKLSSPGRPAFPVWDMAWGSYRFIFVNFDRFLALAWFPITISFIGFIPDFLPHPAIRWVLHILLTMGAYAIFAVRWHRFVLLDDHSGVLSDLPSLRNLRFFLYTLAFMWMPWVPSIIIQYLYPIKSVGDGGTLSPLFIFAVIFGNVMILVLFRLVLLLPAAAIDKPISVRGAWRKMGGNTWNLIGAFVLIIIPLVIFALMLSGFMGLHLTLPLSGGMFRLWVGEFGETGSFALQAVNLLIEGSISLVGLAVGITVLSATHWHLVGPKKPMLTRRRRSDRQR